MYELVHRPGKQHQNDDFFSRLPREELDECQEEGELYPEPAGVLLLEEAPANSPLSAASVARATKEDPLLSLARREISQGWPAHVAPPEIRSYLNAPPGTFTVMHGCILRGSNVVVPECLRPAVLQLLHKVHQGIVRTKALARSYVWWPGIDRDIEEMVKTCAICGETRPHPPQAPVILWSKPNKVWSRLHIDYAGPTKNHTFLISLIQ